MLTVSLPPPRQRSLIRDPARVKEQLAFTLEVEPAGQRGLVARCRVQRTITENTDDDVELVVEVQTGATVERLEFQWAVDHAPPLDALEPGDVVWLDARGDGFTLRHDADLWLRALRAQLVRGRWLVPARAEWNFPVFVERLDAPYHPGIPPREQLQLGRSRLGLFEFKFVARLSALRLEQGSLTVETWAGLVLELADAIERGHLETALEAKARISWSLTGALELGAPTSAKLGPVDERQVALLAELAVPLLANNTLSSARAGRAFLPTTLPVERHGAWREFLSRLAHRQLRSLREVRSAVLSLGVPASRDDVLGVLFSLTPGFFEGVRELLAAPHLLPPTWDALGGRSVEVLTVWHDRWSERSVDPASLAPRVSPPQLQVDVQRPRSFAVGGDDAQETNSLWQRIRRWLR